ncbi:MAG: Integral membrane protein MviN [Parcubacteria group bacterium Gr01-1014_8]|nr:MAG: Integral membrane protein MviN [Parcubacteria group bacterium Gr01-1014_8]
MIGTLRRGLSITGRAFEFLSREVRGMHAAAYILGFSSLLSSLLALLRDRLLAHTFGAGIELDLYYAAFRIPDLLFVAIGALVSAYVLIPVLATRDETGQHRYIDAVVVGFSILAISASALAALAAPWLLGWFFPSLAAGATFPTLILLTRILLLQPIFLGFSNILAAVTQSRHRYALYAAAPIVYNVGIILGIILLYPFFGLAGVAWGVVLGALLHALIQVPSVIRDGFLRVEPLRAELWVIFDTVRISFPRALALSMNQLAFLGLLIIASSLTTGSISIFMFAFNLQAVPLAIIGASYSVAAFPTLATLSRNGSDEFMSYVATAARHVLFWSMPVLMLIIVLRAHVVRVVLGSGEFNWIDTRLTAAALALFAISLAAQGIMLLLVRAYYASGKTLVPLVVSGASALAAILLGLLFLGAFDDPSALTFIEALLRVEFIRGTEILALPLAYSMASLLGIVILAIHFEFSNRGFFVSVGRAFGESITAAFVGAVAAYGTLVVLGTVTFSSTLASVLMRGGVAGLVGLLATAIAYALLGSREFSETVQSLSRRVWRNVEPVSSAEATDVSRA